MTQLIWKCRTCGTLVESLRTKEGNVELRCDCNNSMVFEIDRPIPEGWK